MRIFKNKYNYGHLVKVKRKDYNKAMSWYDIYYYDEESNEQIKFLELYTKFDDDYRFYWCSSEELVSFMMLEILAVVDVLRKEIVNLDLYDGDLVNDVATEMVEITKAD